jgi:PLAT/LH2 domain
MKRAERVRRGLPVVAMAGLSLLLSLRATPAGAYEPDTHYHMTYVLCRAVGFTDAEALVVARFDEGMDDSSDTTATVGARVNVLEETLWHALPTTASPAEVLERKKELYTLAIDEPNPLSSLMRLGVFFHYQQDTWAHRLHPNDSDDSFTPYTAPLGHAIHFHQPDRPPFDPVCAVRCLEDGIPYARNFLTQKLRGTPNSLFDNYSRASVRVDDDWSDSRKGKFFNQVALNAIPLADLNTDAPLAHLFLTDLIRSQIDAYTTSFDFSPAFFGFSTADEATDDRLRPRLQGAIDRAGLPIRVSFRNPMPFLNTPTLVLPSAPGIPPLSRRVPGFTPQGGDGSGPLVDTVLFPVTSDSSIPLLQALTDYTVRLRTGDGATAGTDSTIFLSIKGTSGVVELGEQRLNWQIPGKPFQPSQTDTCVLERLPTIGEIRSVTLRSDGRGADPRWLLGSVEISAPGLAPRQFQFNQEIGPGRLTATLDR